MKNLKKTIWLLPTILVCVIVHQYFFCPQFDFRKGKPFAGTHLYNPYSTTGSWIKCNFHAHTRAWNGLTHGQGTNADVEKKYDSLGYAVHCVSNYQQIDSLGNEENFIPAYEHGFNIKKTHELVLGSHTVRWLDYILPQTLSNKEWILNKLNENKHAVVILNHPIERKGFDESDFNYLTNYDCIEALNPSAYSIAYWDAALSAGNPVFIVGDDDAHNVFNTRSLGRDCTFVNVSRLNAENVLTALKNGNSYGMKIADIPGETVANRKNRLRYQLPGLEKFSLQGDTIQLSVTKCSSNIQFVGQNGKILSVANNQCNASYVIQPQDSYVRAEISFPDGTEMFLNPVFRYAENPFTRTNTPLINQGRTFLFFLGGIAILITWLFLVISFWNRKFFGILNRREQLPEQIPYPALA